MCLSDKVLMISKNIKKKDYSNQNELLSGPYKLENFRTSELDFRPSNLIEGHFYSLENKVKFVNFSLFNDYHLLYLKGHPSYREKNYYLGSEIGDISKNNYDDSYNT